MTLTHSSFDGPTNDLFNDCTSHCHCLPPSRKIFWPVFFDEFPCLLEKLIIASGCLILIDDFNFHVDDKSDPAALKFPQLLLEVFNLP